METIGEDGSLRIEDVRSLGEVENGYSYVRDGDVAVAKITPCFENGKGALMRGLVNGLGFGTTELIVARPNQELMTSEFLHYLFRSAFFRRLGEAQMYGAGGQKRVPDSFVRDFATPLPPLAEQMGITRFLDREVARIDALIAEQRRLIELLEEKRRVCISRAVTQGLQPGVRTKPSGVVWIGDVPAHWLIARVKNISSFLTSGPRGWSDRISDDGALFIQSGDLDDAMGIDFGSAKKVPVACDAESARTRLKDGDVVVCITGAKTGNVAVCEAVPSEAYINQHLCLIRPTVQIRSQFLSAQLKSSVGQTHFALSQYGLKQGLSLEDVASTPIVVPPIAEQDEIVDLIERHLTELGRLGRGVRNAVDLLLERRTSLISAAVTGQIDVRSIADKVAA